MAPRPEVEWIDINDARDTVVANLRQSPHRHFPVCRESIDDVVGITKKEDIFELCLNGNAFELKQVIRQPMAVHEGASVLDTLDRFK